MTSLTILTAGALKEGTLAAATAFERQNGTTVSASYTHGHDICRDILAGTIEADLVGLPIPMIRELQAAGKIGQTPPLHIGNIGIAVAMRAGEVLPKITTMDAFLGAVTGATELVYTTAPSGEHMVSVFAEHGLTDGLAAKTVRFSSGAQVNDYLAEKAPAGSMAFGVTTEIKFYRDKGVQMVGLLPSEIEDVTPYEIAISAAASDVDVARQFLAFLQTPEIATAYADSGVE